MEVEAGEDGGVFELLYGGGGVGGDCCVAVDTGESTSTGAGGGESGADAPSIGDDDRRLDGDVFDGCVGGVEEEFFPLEDGHLRGDTGGDDAVEVGVEGGDAGGDGDVELVEVGVVAAPGEGLAVGGEDYAGDVFYGAGGAVVAGDPLGGGEVDYAGFDGDVDLSVVELAGGVGEVGGDGDGGLLGAGEGGGGEDCEKEDEVGAIGADVQMGVPCW